MADTVTLLLPDFVALIQAHFDPLEARVHFPGSFERVDNIKVFDAHDILQAEFSPKTTPDAEAKIAEIIFGDPAGLLDVTISDPQPDDALEDAFRWDLIARFNIPPELDPEEWLTVPEGRHAWGEWTTWHDHTRTITLTLL